MEWYHGLTLGRLTDLVCKVHTCAHTESLAEYHGLSCWLGKWRFLGRLGRSNERWLMCQYQLDRAQWGEQGSPPCLWAAATTKSWFSCCLGVLLLQETFTETDLLKLSKCTSTKWHFVKRQGPLEMQLYTLCHHGRGGDKGTIAGEMECKFCFQTTDKAFSLAPFYFRYSIKS